MDCPPTLSRTCSPHPRCESSAINDLSPDPVDRIPRSPAGSITPHDPEIDSTEGFESRGSSAIRDGGSPLSRSPPITPESHRRLPIDLLARVFPHMKRSVLQLILQGCNNDVVQAIEQVLNNHSSTSMSSVITPHTLNLPPGITSRAFPTMPSQSSPASALVKSAFSPINSLSPSSHNALRYAYSPATARGLAFAMPYPPSLLPNLATMGYGYSAMAAASAPGAPKTGLPCGMFGPCPYGTPNGSDK